MILRTYLKNFKVTFLLLILITPLAWQLLTKTPQLLTTWAQVPSLISTNFTPYSVDYRFQIAQLRWGNQSLHRGNFYHRIVYSPLHIIINEAFTFTQFLTPTLLYTSGDGTQFSPSRQSPLPIIFIPLTIYGLMLTLRHHNLKIIALLPLSVLPAYLLRERNFAFLFIPTLILIYLTARGLHALPLKYQQLAYILLIITTFHNLLIWLNVL